MEQKWLDDFRALVRHGNFTRAAAERHTTQPAFSRRIVQLEEWCGLPLFNRTAQPVTLTDAGKIFQKRAEKIHEEIRDTQRIMQVAGSHYQNALKIYTTNTLATCYLHEWMSQEKLDGPFSLVIASVNGCIEAYHKGLVDIALIPDFHGDMQGDIRIVRTDYLRLYTSQPDTITDHNGILDGDYLAYMPNTWFGRKIAAYAEATSLKFPAKPVCESASAEALLSLCRHGMGAAWLPDIMAADHNDLIAVFPHYAVSYDILCLSKPR